MNYIIVIGLLLIGGVTALIAFQRSNRKTPSTIKQAPLQQSTNLYSAYAFIKAEIDQHKGGLSSLLPLQQHFYLLYTLETVVKNDGFEQLLNSISTVKDRTLLTICLQEYNLAGWEELTLAAFNAENKKVAKPEEYQAALSKLNVQVGVDDFETLIQKCHTIVVSTKEQFEQATL